MKPEEMQHWYLLHAKAKGVWLASFRAEKEVDWQKFLAEWLSWLAPHVPNNTEIGYIRDGLTSNNGVIWTNRV